LTHLCTYDEKEKKENKSLLMSALQKDERKRRRISYLIE